MKNPFILIDYQGPEYFCGRSEETSQLKSSIENGQNVTIYGIRRTGKSAMIKHVFRQLDQDCFCIYFDIWGTQDLSGFIKNFAQAVFDSQVFNTRSMGKKALDFVKAVKGVFTYDETGKPGIEFAHDQSTNYFKSLREILQFLAKQKKTVVVAIDEFQEIRTYGESVPLEAQLRSLVQDFGDIRFIFCGSEHHIISDMFNNYRQPFYQSTTMLTMEPIPLETYKGFILEQFQKAKKSINPTLVEEILELTHLHTHYVQRIFNYLFSQRQQPENMEQFHAIFKPFLRSQRSLYDTTHKRLTDQQFATLKAIASTGKVENPFGEEFRNKAGVKQYTGMKRIIKALEEKQYIVEEHGKYRLYDIFLAFYIRYFY